MYSTKSKQKPALERDYTKNPNRVAGGLRGQGVDAFEMLGEDGSIQRIPTHAYVQSLEEQIRKLRAQLNVLERKSARSEKTIEQLMNIKRSS